MRPDKIFASTAFLVLTLVVAAYVWRHWIEKPTIQTTVRWYEKPISLEGKTETKKGVDLPPPTTTPAETVWATAPCDSVRKWAKEHMMPFQEVFKKDIGFQDSLVSFHAQRIDTVRADPWTRLLTLATHYDNAILKAARVETKEVVTETDWLVSLGAFIVGILLVLLLN